MTQDTLSEAEYDAITDAAAHWCMRLHAVDCTDQERRDIRTVARCASPACFRIRSDAGNLGRCRTSAAPRSSLPVGAGSRQPSRSWRRYAVAAGVCALALPLAAYTGWNLGWLPNSYEHFAATDNVRQVTLSDGSQLELNLNTELTFSNYKDERRVTLKKGEAFFTVSHDMPPSVCRARRRRQDPRHRHAIQCLAV